MKLFLLISCFFPLSLLAMHPDTVRLKNNELLLLKDTIYAPRADTFLVLNTTDYKIRKNPYKTSEAFYQRIEEKTGQNKLTAKLFDLLYVEPNATSENKNKKINRTSNAPFMQYEGLRIGEIKIKHVELLQGDVNDTMRTATSGLVKIADQLHINTWNSVIRNSLRMKSGDVINPFVIADNERLLRRLRFIRDARIYLAPSGDSEEADIIVVVQDRFAWGVKVDIDNIDQVEGQLINRNIAGTGKFAAVSYVYNQKETNPGYSMTIGGQNIDKFITNWNANHLNAYSRSEWGVVAEKDFLTPDVKYGGGIDVRNVKDSTLHLYGDALQNGQYQLNYTDVWVGRAFRLPSKYQRKNLTLSSRWLNNDFGQRPFVSRDSNSAYFNRNLFLSELSISSQKFLKTNYITSFGVSEDIPLGYRISAIGGRDFNEFFSQNYYGVQLFWSVYVKDFGFLLFNQQAGAFDKSKTKRGVFKTTINYFSPLLEFNRYYMRNFVKLSFTNGIDQPLTSDITLKNRIRDLNGSSAEGNGAAALSIESVTYAPWYFYGFRFAPFCYYNIGEVWDNRNDRSYSIGYQGVGGGIRIRNESLAFSTLEFRVTHFITGQELESSTLFSFSSTIPIEFDNIFKFKPTVTAFR